jgi:hypothetical protein
MLMQEKSTTSTSMHARSSLVGGACWTRKGTSEGVAREVLVAEFAATSDSRDSYLKDRTGRSTTARPNRTNGGSSQKERPAEVCDAGALRNPRSLSQTLRAMPGCLEPRFVRLEEADRRDAAERLRNRLDHCSSAARFSGM